MMIFRIGRSRLCNADYAALDEGVRPLIYAFEEQNLIICMLAYYGSING